MKIRCSALLLCQVASAAFLEHDFGASHLRVSSAVVGGNVASRALAVGSIEKHSIEKTAAAAYASASRRDFVYGKSPFTYLVNQSAISQANTIFFQFQGNLRGSEGEEAPLSRRTLWLIVMMQCAFICVLMFCWPMLAYYVSSTVGFLVKEGIEKFDQDVIGVDVNIGSLYPDIMHGILHIQDLVVHNPPGWDSPHLLKAGTLLVDFDMSVLFWSGFQKVEIEKLIFKDVNFIYEKGWKSSNVNDVLDFLQDKRKDKEDAKKAAAKPIQIPKNYKITKPKPVEAKDEEEEEEKKTPKETDLEVNDEASEWVVHVVEVKDVDLRMQGKMVGGRGGVVAVGDFNYADFSKEVGNTYLDDVVQVLLKSVLKTILSNICGTGCSQAVL